MVGLAGMATGEAPEPSKTPVDTRQVAASAVGEMLLMLGIRITHAVQRGQQPDGSSGPVAMEWVDGLTRVAKRAYA